MSEENNKMQWKLLKAAAVSSSSNHLHLYYYIRVNANENQNLQSCQRAAVVLIARKDG
jgi:hypothetical protein